MNKIKVFLVIGARPNIMKVAPVFLEMKKMLGVFKPFLVHTGQHYDENMSGIFLKQMGLPEPDFYLGTRGNKDASDTGRIMSRFENFLEKEKPDIVIVVGDVNSTLACALAAKRKEIKIAHIEAGLRSFDWKMPEEMNRVLTDRISDFLFTTCKEANFNLLKEGIEKEKIHFVGNVMIDSLVMSKRYIDESNILVRLGISRFGSGQGTQPTREIIGKRKKYAVVTLHRPSNVDEEKSLMRLWKIIQKITELLAVIFPVHPRTKKMIEKWNLEFQENLILTEPMGYFDFLKLQKESTIVLTDSGGIQEETTYLGVPCITLRENTERGITIKEGTNELVGIEDEKIFALVKKAISGKWKQGNRIKYWDGKASVRIVKILSSLR